MKSLILIAMLSTVIGSCQANLGNEQDTIVRPGAWQLDEYIDLLRNKSVGLVLNQTSTINGVHLVDSLVDLGINIKSIFGPEHSFRGDAYDGEIIDDSIDPSTGLPIISLYGSHKKPTKEDLEEIDIMVYDIQDVGARFYTYISTMHYVMEACAEYDVPLIILDRPNPNGHYLGGPVLEPGFQSFIGMHPIPMVYGLTSGELAQMINGEGWLDSAAICDITVIKNKNYSHNSRYSLPIPPSPNLPNARAIELYPSLCLFEPTIISIGRGTGFPFQVLGYPDSTKGDFTFTPVSINGASKYPKHQDIACFGEDLRAGENLESLDLTYLMQYFSLYGANEDFFLRPAYFDKLAGTDKLRIAMLDGKSLEEIENSWQEDLSIYKVLRKKYLLYNDFE
jgi:uncharacterized protein YbbC (DUF1343 family)